MTLPNRKATRLKNFDYSAAGAYFITVCTYKKQCIFSEIVGEAHEPPFIKLSRYGQIADRIINTLEKRFDIKIPVYTVMPNHIHMLIEIAEKTERATRELPLHNPYSISQIIGYLKMNVSKEMHECGFEDIIWQRSFHDHIVRSSKDYSEIYNYIKYNHHKWEKDCFYTY